MVNFEDLLKKQQEAAQSGEMYQTDAPKFKSDERFYTISKDQDGNGSVKVRFLPSLNRAGDTLLTWVKRHVHNVKGEKLFAGQTKPEIRSFWGDDAICPKTKGEDCPICNHGWALYEKAKENGASKEELRGILSNWINKDEVITNIMVLEDKINPSNNGKIFLFKVSKTVLDIFAKENERIVDLINSGASKEELLTQGVPEGVNVFDVYNLLSSKNVTLKYKNKKFVKQPSDYWGSTMLDMNFSSFVKDAKEYQEIVSKTFCLEEFTKEADIKDTEFLESKIEFLEFRNTNTKPKQETYVPPVQETYVPPVQETYVPSVEPVQVQQPEPPVQVQETRPEPVQVQQPEPPVQVQETRPEPVQQPTIDEDDFFNKFKV